ncbi:hypothetical protein U1Q18_008243 [Sarracenia purpurea var. burkii]
MAPMGEPLYQFPQPTRPPLSYDTDLPEAPFPQERSAQEFHHPDALQVPKASRRPVVLSDEEYRTTQPRHPHAPPQSNVQFSESDQEFHHPDALQLPKASRRPVVLSDQDDRTTQSRHPHAPPQSNVQFSESARDYRTSSEPCASKSSEEEERTEFSPATGKTPKREKEAVDELLAILLECMEEVSTRSRESLLRKFFSEIEKEERLETFIVDRLKQTRVKAISELCEKLPATVMESSDGGGSWVTGRGEAAEDNNDSVATRSLDESVEDMTQKLERFKVRTFVMGGGIIKDDEKK